MPKHPARSAIDDALREIVFLDLRRRGFRGAFPHFRRPLETRIDLLTFQFNRSGGSFVVELAQCGASGISQESRQVPPDKVRAWDVFQRLRLGSDGLGDHWFEYSQPNYEADHEEVKPKAHYEAIANEVVRLLDSQGEPYWKSKAASLEASIAADGAHPPMPRQ